MKPISKNGYFIDEAGAEAFNLSFLHMLADRKTKIFSQYLSPHNTHRLRHGGDWSHPGAPEVYIGGMQTHSASVETKFQNLVDNDLGAIDRTVQVLMESMHQQFAQMLYSSLSAVCDQTGNSVDAKAEGSLVGAFIAMLEKIEFVADKYGCVSLPQIHAGPDTATSLLEAMEAATPEEKEHIEAIKARKIAEALKREADRKAKFVCYGENM